MPIIRVGKVGKIVRDLRKEKKITSERLARAAGLDRTSISKLENHNILPLPHVFWKIILGLRCSYKEAMDLRSLYIDQKYPELADFDEAMYEEYVNEIYPDSSS